MTALTIEVYRKGQARRIAALLFGGLLVLCFMLADLAIGPAWLSLGELWSVLTQPGAFRGGVLHAIVWDIRLPMTLTSVVVGASLGLAGAQMQTILRNPLASPYTLGISAAAGFGASVIMLTGLGTGALGWLAPPLAAFITALLACMGVWTIGKLRGVTPEVLVLAGIAMLFLFQSLQSLLQYLASPEVLQQIVFWLFGSLLKANWTSFTVSGALFCVVTVGLLGDAWRLTVLGMGDDNARSLGVNVDRLRLRVFVWISLLTAGAVAFVGTIGFVGLVAPHIARDFVGEDQRYLIPLSALSGAAILTGASLAAKLISPGAMIPIGIVTALTGVPFLFFLILRRKR